MERLALLLALLVCSAGAGRAQQELSLPVVHPPLCQRLHDPGPGFQAAYLCLGVPPWTLVPALWTPLSVTVNCTAPTVSTPCRMLALVDSASAAAPVWVIILAAQPLPYPSACRPRPPPCPQYEIFTAPTWDDLQEAPQPVRWCGFAHFAQPATCSFSLSPFEDAVVAIRTRRQGSLLGMSE
jgi:hypothetical protein